MKSLPLFRTLALSCVLSAAFVAMPGSAHAEDGDAYPLVYGQRPIVLTQGLSQIEAAFSALKFDGPGDAFIRLDASFDYGVLDDLTVGILAVPLALSPDADYGNPNVYARYRLLSGGFDLGVSAGLSIPVQSGTSLGLNVGVLARFFLNKAAHFNVGAYLGVSFADGTPLSLHIPVDLAISFSRNIFFSIETGFAVPNLDADLWSIPLGVGLGYTLEADTGGPLLDIYLKFGLPYLVNSSKSFENMTWQATLGGRFYL